MICRGGIAEGGRKPRGDFPEGLAVPPGKQAHWHASPLRSPTTTSKPNPSTARRWASALGGERHEVGARLDRCHGVRQLLLQQETW